MQLTENDTTQDMPANLPPEPFIPEEGSVGAGVTRPIQGLRPVAPALRPSHSVLLDNINPTLQKIGLADSVLGSVQEGVRQGVDRLSREFAELSTTDR